MPARAAEQGGLPRIEGRRTSLFLGALQREMVRDSFVCSVDRDGSARPLPPALQLRPAANPRSMPPRCMRIRRAGPSRARGFLR